MPLDARGQSSGDAVATGEDGFEPEPAVVEPAVVPDDAPPPAFSTLEQGREVAALFARYPKLREYLRGVYVATLDPATLDPTAPDGLAPDQPQRREALYGDDDPPSYGRSRGRGRGRGRGNTRPPPPWTPERGMRRGLHQLTQRPRNDVDQVAEGAEEFRRLVLQKCMPRGDGDNVAQVAPSIIGGGGGGRQQGGVGADVAVDVDVIAALLAQQGGR